MEKDKLNLGCGQQPKEGYLNIDIIKFQGVDKVVDLNKFPYPFKKNTFEIIEMDSVLEHLSDVPKVLEELYKIAKPNAKIKLIIPHFASLTRYIDPTHKTGFAWNYFDYFDKDNKVCNDYKFKCNLKTISKEITFPKHLKWFKIIANKIPGFYDTNLCYIIRPHNLEITLKVIKEI